ncbi:hypothetical protein V6N11_058819 [Hibiscus sabdariffa]|uniref:Aspartyl aminopeptidase n=1 Tax=Hibiscus sabdariffa TaxID=183260 RepID=A0ABR2U5D5_9ROSI
MAETEVSFLVSDFIGFLNASPTAFHAVDEAMKLLQKIGYEQVIEREDWKLEAGKRYFFTRNHSTIVAFAIGKKYVAGNGFHIVGAHTDSPCLKLKPVSEVKKAGYLEVGVQTYGGGLWDTWFDRDLTVAGRVMIREEKGGSVSYAHQLVRIEEPIMRISTLAIHLDREIYFLIILPVSWGVNAGFKVNTQSHLLPVLATSIKAELNKEVAENGSADKTMNKSRHHALLLQMIANKLGCQPGQICDFELQACDTQPSIVAGAAKEFIFSGRLDNLCMSFCCLKGLIDATSSDSDLENESGVRMVALFDHEEVGSNSTQGVGSPAMLDALSGITNSFTSDSKMLTKAIQGSFLVSADMAHALHPNYMDKHEENHQHKEIAVKHNLLIQDFVVRNDMPCGSTIGPILASGVGIRTLDVGAPQLSMHSIREMCAVDDVKHSYQHFKAFFQEFSQLDTNISVDA